jgi:O-antigen ligase
VKKIVSRNYEFTLFIAAFTILIITPWMNVDAMIIPKMALLFCLALYLIPYIFNLRNLINDNMIKLTFLVSFLLIIHLFLIVILSNAPIEQQIYGRTGRGLGLFTQVSLLIVMLYIILDVEFKKMNKVNFWLAISCFLSSVYSIFQYFGLDLFAWNTRTNGIIGTLGNPNFQSSFTAMSIIPTLAAFWKHRFRIFILPIILATILFSLFLSNSTQGYILLASTFAIFSIVFTWYRTKAVSILALSTTLFMGLITLLGMFNYGPLSNLLYKISVQSRREFFQASVNMSNDNPIFGVGLDSFSDFYLMYRDEKSASGINEFTDNAHNFYLQYSSTGGYPLALFYVLIVGITLYSFIRLQRSLNRFNLNLTAIFCGWFAFQLQSLISPASIGTLLWNFIFSGVIIGLAAKNSLGVSNKETTNQELKLFTVYFSRILIILGILIMYPLIKSDNLIFKANNRGDGLAVISAVQKFPESSLNYARVGGALIESNLGEQALQVSRAAVSFNPNSISAWVLILANQGASIEERRKAASEVMRLDPYNKVVEQFESQLEQK